MTQQELIARLLRIRTNVEQAFTVRRREIRDDVQDLIMELQKDGR